VNQDSPNALTKTLATLSVLEIATGLALLADPALVVRLLLGVTEGSEQLALARFVGITLFALGIACWPHEQRSKPDTAAFRGMLVYNLAIAVFLAYLNVAGHIGGALLWPAVILHAIVGIILVLELRNAPRRPPERDRD
jgi:hypothetical protein